MSAARSLAGYRAWETRKERDEFAAANIPDSLLPLWERTKLNFRGTPEERAEKFIQYAHDHEDEDIEAVTDAADRKLQAMIRAREASGGFASLGTLALILGAAAAAYLVYRATRKKPSPPQRIAPPLPHHVSGLYMAPEQPAWPEYHAFPEYPWASA